MKKLAVLIALGLILAPTVMFAATAATPIGPSVVPPTLEGGPNDLVCLIKDVTNWIFTIFLVTAVFFILLAAYYYLLAQGSGEEVAKTHKMLIWSAVAIAVAILSRGFIVVVQKVVGVSVQDTACGAPVTTKDTTDETSPPVSTQPSNFTQVGPASNGITVETCSDGQVPGVIVSQLDSSGKTISSNKFNDNTNIKPNPGHGAAGFYTVVSPLAKSPSIAVQGCNDGAIPHIIINTTRY